MKKRKPTAYQILQELAEQVNAMLLFATPVDGEHLRRPSRAQQDDNLRNLYGLAEALQGRLSPEKCCGCGKPIRRGSPYFSYEDEGPFHPACSGYSIGAPAFKRLPRTETIAGIRAKLKVRTARARDYLKARGRIA
jgi:hypothetical protein